MKLFIVLALAVASVSAGRLDKLIKPAFASGRIVNGIEAVPGEAPYIVSLQRTNDNFHFCAGSLLSPNWVLTAGHCLIYESFNVVAGLHDRTKIFNNARQVRVVTTKNQYKAHEEYKDNVGPNDIGLIYLPDGFIFDDPTKEYNGVSIANIDLPSGKYSQLGGGKLYGWGNNATGKSPERLQSLEVDIIGYSKCRSELPYNAPLDEFSNICTHAPYKIDGSCNGDSGGPLMRKTVSGFELVGVVSWGYSPCHWSTYPSVYTMVSGFLRWIEDSQRDLAIANKL